MGIRYKMKTHELKCWPKFFWRLQDGTKLFEYRENDRNFQVGDQLLIHEYDPVIRQYCGNQLLFEITYILQHEMNIPQGYCILSLKKLSLLDMKPENPL